MDEEIINRKVDRRRLLGRAGAVAATVAGAGTVAAAVGSPAGAAPGEPVLQGTANDAGTSVTQVRNDSQVGPTMLLRNDRLTPFAGKQESGPALLLRPNGDHIRGEVGSLGVNSEGTLWIVDRAGQSPAFVRTAYNSTIVKSFTPVRILDTRPEESAGKGGMLNPSVVNSQGFIGAGRTLNLSLDSLFTYVETIFANITVIAGSAAGFVSAWPGGRSRPNASNVNFSPGQTVANFAVVGVGSISVGAEFAISIYAHTPAKVIVDISGAVVNVHEQIIWSRVPGGDPRGLRGMASTERAYERPEIPPQP